MQILVTGISGYVGAALAPRLLRDGHDVRGLSRRGHSAVPGVSALRGDVESGAGLEAALEGVDVAYYLIHSMEQSSDGAFDTRERRGAERFAAAAQAAGVRRIVYLGGPMPAGEKISMHLASRLEVERILLAATPDSVAFRASVLIGARSASFRFLVRIVERMPVLPVPAWGAHRSAPIDQRDAVELLARAAGSPAVSGLSLDIRGPEILTYQDFLERIVDAMLIARPTFAVPRLSLTPIVSRVASTISGSPYALVGPLMESLDSDLLPRDDRAAELLGVRLHSLGHAIERALREWEREAPLRAR
jgi:uncharacterized protein YbjT (DUF2867 family)